MTDETTPSLPVDAADIARRLEIVGFQDDDRERVRALAPVIVPAAEELADLFFAALARMPGAAGLLDDARALGRARALKVAHLRAMMEGTYGVDYVVQRLALARIYAAAGIAPHVFIGAFHELLHAIGLRIMQSPGDHLEHFARFKSLKQVAFFDLGLIIDAIVHQGEQVIRRQAAAIRALSTPMFVIRDGVVVAPIVGDVDDERAQTLVAALLAAVRAHRAQVAIIDVTGVPDVDSRVAGYFMQMARTARLLGAAFVFTGISAEVAGTMIRLGVDLSDVATLTDLREGIAHAEHLLA